MAVRQVQAELRQAFARWGLPGGLRVDNGSPWGTWSDWPTALALWLLGLGVGMIWNDPRRPQPNGVVERSQGTGKRWAEPQQCDTIRQLQERLEASDRLQRDHYPYAGEASRSAVFPELAHSGHAYDRRREARQWDLGHVLGHLADYVVPRPVDRSGTISVVNRTVYVGKRYAGQTVWVRLDPQEVQWVIADGRGAEIRVKDAAELSAQSICALRVMGEK